MWNRREGDKEEEEEENPALDLPVPAVSMLLCEPGSPRWSALSNSMFLANRGQEGTREEKSKFVLNSLLMRQTDRKKLVDLRGGRLWTRQERMEGKREEGRRRKRDEPL